MSPTPANENSDLHFCPYSSQSDKTISNERTFVCTYEDCHESYTGAAQLKRHQEIHFGKFQCTVDNCERKFKSKTGLKKHIRKLHNQEPPKKYKCSHCSEEFNKHSLLISHEFKHTGVEPYACPKESCGKRFLIPSKLNKHMKLHADQRPFVCTYKDCDKSYMLAAHLKRHEEIHIERIQCTVGNCQMKFKSKAYLNKHICKLHKEKKKYKCSQCGEEFNKHNWLRSHEFKHTGVEPYACPVKGCGKTCLFLSKFKKHMKYHKGYTCTNENCGQFFSKWSQYTDHMRLSHPRIYKCHFCERIFYQSQNLKGHMEIHKLDREVLWCPESNCTRFYTLKRNLDHHIRVYHDERPFICTLQYCYKTFKTEADMKAHSSLHTKPKRRKKKKGKPKPTYAARLAGLAPKLQPTLDDKVENVEVETSDDNTENETSTSDDNTENETSSSDDNRSDTERSQDELEITVSNKDVISQSSEKVPSDEENSASNSYIYDELKITISNEDISSQYSEEVSSDEENGASNSYICNEIEMLLDMTEKRKETGIDSTFKETNIASVKS